MEGKVDATEGLVAVLHQQAARAVDDKGQDGKDAEGPGQADVADHGVGGEGVDEAAETGAGSGNGVGKGAAEHEPLRDDANGGVEGEAHADAEADTLGEQ